MMRTLKSIPMVAVDDSGSNWSSQYLVNTVHSVSGICFVDHLIASHPISRKKEVGNAHADFPAPEGPMSSIFRVGSESSEAISSDLGL